MDSIKPDRRESENEWRDRLHKWLTGIDSRVSSLETRLDASTGLINKIADDTKSIREFMNDGANAAKFMCRMAKAWKFMVSEIMLPMSKYIIAPLIVGYVAIYIMVTDGEMPTWAARLTRFFTGM